MRDQIYVHLTIRMNQADIRKTFNAPRHTSLGFFGNRVQPGEGPQWAAPPPGPAHHSYLVGTTMENIYCSYLYR